MSATIHSVNSFT